MCNTKKIELTDIHYSFVCRMANDLKMKPKDVLNIVLGFGEQMLDQLQDEENRNNFFIALKERKDHENFIEISEILNNFILISSIHRSST